MSNVPATSVAGSAPTGPGTLGLPTSTRASFTWVIAGTGSAAFKSFDLRASPDLLEFVGAFPSARVTAVHVTAQFNEDTDVALVGLSCANIGSAPAIRLTREHGFLTRNSASAGGAGFSLSVPQGADPELKLPVTVGDRLHLAVSLFATDVGALMITIDLELSGAMFMAKALSLA